MMACGSIFLQEATIRDNLMMSAREAATNVDIVMFPGILEADMETRPLGHGKLEADHPDLPVWTTRSAARARRPPMTRLWTLLTGSQHADAGRRTRYSRHTPHACTTSPITARHRQADRWPSRRPHQAQVSDSAKGPTPGVKYRGGTPPQAPSWHYDRADLRAFGKWKKKVEIWMLQIINHVPRKEASLLLYNSLKGELGEELEDADVNRIYHPNGVEFILQTVQQAVEARSVHLKRKLLNDYEHVQRVNQDSMRSYVNRYRRTERALENLGAGCWTGQDCHRSIGTRARAWSTRR